MKALIIYDSVFGNTEKIAREMELALAAGADCKIIRAAQVQSADLAGLDLILVGSPTRGFRPTEATSACLKKIPAGSLNGVKAAAFDTRISVEDVKSPFLSFMVKLFGYAAAPIASSLKKKGASLAVEPQGFIVQASEGPLKDGELQRAAAWAQSLL